MSDEAPTALLITAVKDIATLTALMNTILLDIKDLSAWKENMQSQQQSVEVKLSNHETRLATVEGKLKEVRDRWHQYAISFSCGIGASFAASIVKSHFGLP